MQERLDFDLMFGSWTLVTQERFLDLDRFAENLEAMMAQNYINSRAQCSNIKFRGNAIIRTGLKNNKCLLYCKSFYTLSSSK